jgi:adenosylmethionine-8-amino-7-oxononanoate aminotransferase
MILNSRVDPRKLIGLSPERLSVEQLRALAGLVVALELYTPETTPVRTIEAIGETAEECMAELAARGLNVRRFEYVMLKAPY